MWWGCKQRCAFALLRYCLSLSMCDRDAVSAAAALGEGWLFC